ncbi:hypothetical protein JWR97_06650 [Pseudomonas cedrina subsp. fulgida]|nr:hypothetical protein [Pseudomonas cedrina subsp. fulgida]
MKSTDVPPGGASEQVDAAAQTIVDLADEMAEQYPTPQKVVSSRVKQDIKGFTKAYGKSELDIDPDRTFIQHFSEDDPNYEKYGFKRKGDVVGEHKKTSQPKSLTQAVADNDPWSDDRVSGGQTVIFTGDPDNPKYDPAKRVDLDPAILPAIARNRDLAKEYGNTQREFWQKNFSKMQSLHEKHYMYRAAVEAANGTLSKDGLDMVVEAAEFKTPGQSNSKHVQRSLLEINGYRSTGIVVLTHKETGRVVVYMPSDGQSFFEFKNEAGMRKWLFEMAKTEEGRASIEGHFTSYYLRDGPYHDGVSSTLKKMGNGDKDALNNKKIVGSGRPESRIEGDMFENLTKVQSWDAISEGDEMIKSNRKILLARISKLAGASSVIFPPAVFLTGPAQISISAWQANNGHTAQERSAGVVGVGLGIAEVGLSMIPGGWIGKLLKPVVKRGTKIIKGLAGRSGSYSIPKQVGKPGSRPPKPGIDDAAPPPKNPGTPDPTITQMGGKMNNFHVLGGEVNTFTDFHKGGTRLNIVAHGIEPGFVDKLLGRPAKVSVNGKSYTAPEFVVFLRSRGIDPASSRYSEVRLLMCYSGNAGEKSFGREFQKAVGKPVKAYEGTVSMHYGATPMENIRQHEFIKARAANPTLSDSDIHTLVDSKFQQKYSGQVNQYVEKADGSVMTIPEQNGPGTQQITIEYKPVRFS